VNHQETDVQQNLCEPLAIIGMNCRFPGKNKDVEDVDAFYALLMQQADCIREIPYERWDSSVYFDANRKKADKHIARKGGFLSSPQGFDAPFFKISAAEAKHIDPQHRIFLEVAIRALQHANITLESLSNSQTGVFCGASTNEYSQLNIKDNIKFNAYTLIGMAASAAAGRVAHFLNLKGPCMAIDTACSSSLSALYVAANALRDLQCSMAIVGGVHLNLCPENFVGWTKANMLSAQDKCQSFAKEADGFVISEGCGVVIVKRLQDAIRDGDTIYTIIKSVVMNQDGSGGALVAPNINSQIELHQQVLQSAGLVASDIDYIEAHATGTFLGDSTEFNAIRAIHQGQHSFAKPLVLGALKSQIGHTITASGVAGLIKATLSLKHETIPANLHNSSPNIAIDPNVIPVLFPVQPLPFPQQQGKKRYVQISNFGFSGTNVSAIIEDFPNKKDITAGIRHEEPFCFVVSAKSIGSLTQMLSKMTDYLKNSPADLRDICTTLINCRDHFKIRCAIMAQDKTELIHKLEVQQYETHKVTLNNEIEFLADPTQLYEKYLQGYNIRVNDNIYNKVDLPLYCFERKDYWHEARIGHQPSFQRSNLNEDSIAIIGMSCRLPKAKNVDEFLILLDQGENGMTDIPLERWDNEKYYDKDPDVLGKLYIKQLGLIDNFKNFDADFFNISPREAKLMAPQLRVFMETSFHAIEDANLSLDSLRGSKTGVFVGCGTNDYPESMLKEGLVVEDLNIYFATGNVLNAIPGRIAYSFDFRGPIQAIDTACSSSMTAIHNACVSLQSGECDMALAGGVNMLLSPESNITLTKAKMLSPESRCKTFSADADGYARSEGCGVLLLKRLNDAIRDQDNILAVVKGSSTNSGGKSGGFTVPNGVAQEEVILNAMSKAKISPQDIDLIEVHGTGTPLADPIETNTLMKLFSSSHSEKRPLYLSSVKTNIGHCEAASGVASVIKTVLSLQERKIFKHLNFKELNPAIELKNAVIPLERLDWPKEKGLRTAGVSSFGFSGANAHVILQEAPKKETINRSLPANGILLISARSKEALELLLASYHHYLLNTEETFADICYTAATCRTHFMYRVALLAKSAQHAVNLLAEKKYTIFHIKKERKLPLDTSNLEALKKGFEEGAIMDWLEYYRAMNLPFLKVKLPLYEFFRTEYWFGEKGKIKDEPLPKNWSYQLQWELQNHDEKHQQAFGKKWLFIGEKQIAEAFIAQGLSLYFLENTESFSHLDGVIFAPALSPAPPELHANLERQKNLIKQLLNLIKRLHAQSVSLRLIVLTRHGIAELADDEINISNSSLLGFCKTLTLELPQFSTIVIDADVIDDHHYPKVILAELQHNHGQFYEHLIAYRRGKRHVARLKYKSVSSTRKSIQGQGCYLITGGCGGLGFISAQALLSSGARDVVLVSRTVDTPYQKEMLQKIKVYYPWARIRALSVDITNKKQLQKLMLTLNKNGLLKGIIHAAGAAIKAPLIAHKDEDVDHLFSAKVLGGWYLHEFSQHLNLDFFVVYSSIAAVFGSNRESVYSGANSFLDALITERHRLGLVGTAVQWGPWGEVGMAQSLSSDNLKNALISNSQGHSFIKLIINSDVKHTAIISPEYLKFMLDFVPNPKPGMQRSLSKELGSFHLESLQNSLTPWLDEYAELDSVQRLAACNQLIRGICCDILEVGKDDYLDEEEGFFEIGFDSLMITELATNLKKVVGPAVKITVSIGFNHPSIRKLAEYIQKELDETLPNEKGYVAAKIAEDDIAIIGMSCSLPNAPDIASFEKLLEEGLSGIKDIPIERWDNRIYYDPNVDASRKSYVNKLGLIENIKLFDANFFGISPREAKLMEPQQRIFLECCYKVLENANYPQESLRGSLTGVFVGVGPNEYYAQLEQSGFSDLELSAYSITGNVLNLIPGRVAYTFDFKGPSISIDTACSSSLVAIHYACQSLKNREINYALAGGVNILLRPESNVTLCKARALSPEGLCKTFDEGADGYARAEGCGVIFLKRLADAIRDEDHILAVIKGSAVNNDGRSAGLTVPNGKSQEDVMQHALKQSALQYHDVGYIEAHGTGTPLGDPVEVHAINKVYGNGRTVDNPLYIGTVKTNIGHLESAAGVAGVIKAVIGLQKKKIYKILNFNKINPNINLEATRLPLQNIAWNSQDKLNCTGVNAFGFSGTNAHLILQEFRNSNAMKATSRSGLQVLLISAKSKVALDNLVSQYQRFLETTEHEFYDICYTAATCREHYQYRLAVAAENSKNAGLALLRGDFALVGKNTLELAQEDKLNALLLKYLQGEEVDWRSYYQSLGDAHKVGLPNYIFDGLEFWPDKKLATIPHSGSIHPLLGQMISMPSSEYLFSNKLNLEHLSYIKEHRVFERVTFLGAAFIEMGLAAAKMIFSKTSFRIERMHIERPLLAKHDQELQAQVKPKVEDHYKMKVFAKHHDQWQIFSEMDILPTPVNAMESIDLTQLISTFDARFDLTDIYNKFKSISLDYGTQFQVLQEGYVNSDQVLTRVALHKNTPDQGYLLHPVLLDGALQSVFLFKPQEKQSTYVPYAFTAMEIFQASPKQIWAHLRKRSSAHENDLCFDIKLYDNAGLLVAYIEELKLRAVHRSNFMTYESVLSHLYYTGWNPIPCLQEQLEIPLLTVISKDPAAAKELLGNNHFKLVHDIKELETLEKKHLVFLFAQGQWDELFYCCQQMFSQHPSTFILVTQHAYGLREKDSVNPYHTMANALWKTFCNESGMRNSFAIDVASENTIQSALAYIFTGKGQEKQFAVYDALYVPRLKRKQLVVQKLDEKSLFSENASYLITGGTGGLAKPLIEYLIQRGVKHLILVSRSPCSIAIKSLIEHQPHVEIKHITADAANYQSMEHLIQSIENGPYPLKGVFHLAGVVRDGLMINLSAQDNQQVLNAKMESALILHQVTRHLFLDTFVLFSSSASILGARGQANYAAANGFLDGLAHLRRQQGLPGISINWGPFDDTGMTRSLNTSLRQHGFILLDHTNIEILDLLLKSSLAQIAPCLIQWEIYSKHSGQQIFLNEVIKKNTPATPHFLNALRKLNPTERAAAISQCLCEISADVLGKDTADVILTTDSLISMGLDSLMSMEIRNRIHDKLQCPYLSLSIEHFINDPSVAKIAQKIALELEVFFANKDEGVLFENESVVEAPLSDFQYAFWAIDRLNLNFNIGTQLILHGNINPEYVAQAMDAVVQQHAAFWLEFDSEAPFQRLRKQGEFKLIVNDISLEGDSNSLDKEYLNNIHRCIPLNQPPLIRVFLYKVNRYLHQLHVVIPHIIVDDWSCNIVLDQFKRNYTRLAQGELLVHQPPKQSYLDFVHHHLQRHEQNLVEKMEFWQAYNYGFKLLNLGPMHQLRDAASPRKHLFHYPIQKELIESFFAWHKNKNINISSGLIAAVQLILYKLSNQQKIPIILIHSGREGSVFKDVVGLFSEYKRINTTVNGQTKFINCIKAIENELLKTAPYQKCPHFIKDRGLKGFEFTFSQYLVYLRNRLKLKGRFQKTQLNSEIIDAYLGFLSRIEGHIKSISFKSKLNKLFKLKLPLQKPERLRVLVSITPTLFTKDPLNLKFADIHYEYANHIGCMERSTGNRTLWIYFSKDQHGEYFFTVNGPLTAECKNQMAIELHQILCGVLQNEDQAIAAVMS
jgi:acyl transferase domain-containing protein/acyl carrier protein